MKYQSFLERCGRSIAITALIAAALLLMTQLQPSDSQAEKMWNPGALNGFPRRDYDYVGFIGTVTKFETPVYGVGTALDPVSIIHFNVEERFLGSDRSVTELVSYGTIWTDKNGRLLKRGGFATHCLYLNPGMRVLVMGQRRGPQLAEEKGYNFGGHYVVSFCRLLPDVASSAKSETLQIVGEPVWPKEGSIPGLDLEKALAEPLIIPTYQDYLTLDGLMEKVTAYYGEAGQ